MFNVIKMELHRLLRSKSLYVTAGVCAGTILLLIMLTAAVMEALTYIPEETVSVSDAVSEMTVTASDTVSISGTTNPVNFCGSFINGVCAIIVVIFVAIFIHGFYKDGYSKNVIACVRSRWYFQAARAVCVAVYCAILLVVASLTSILSAAVFVKDFELSCMGVFFLFLLGEFLLLNAIGLLSALLTELTYSKVTAIVYILLASTNLVSGLLSLLESKLSDIFNTEIVLWKYLPSLYQSNYGLEAPDTSGNGAIMTHAVLLSLAFIAIYNLAGALLITKRDVK